MGACNENTQEQFARRSRRQALQKEHSHCRRRNENEIVIGELVDGRERAGAGGIGIVHHQPFVNGNEWGEREREGEGGGMLIDAEMRAFVC